MLDLRSLLVALVGVTLLSGSLVPAAAQSSGSQPFVPPAPNRPGVRPPTVDIELVLAVDVSLSMDLDEQRLQREGYVAAFRHPVVINAMTTGPLGRVAVTYVEWAGAGTQEIVIPWRVIDSAAAANSFADDLAAKRISRARMTSISSMLEFAADLFELSGERGLRRVVDVSGDGPNNSGPPVDQTRDALVARGIVINGLPIMLKPRNFSGYFDITGLDGYYRDCVIGGPGAFVISVKAAGEFPTAIRQKLLLEIAGIEQPGSNSARLQRIQYVPPGAAGPGRGAGPGGSPQPAEPKADCQIGERMWRQYNLDRYQQ